MRKAILWLAQGFGTGWIPWAPGTFGSLLGILWFLLLLLPGEIWFYMVGCLLGLLVAIPICGRAEEVLGAKDPGSVVLDEIAALPLVYLGWLVWELHSAGTMLDWRRLGGGKGFTLLLVGFLLFRLLDALKPPPIWGLQRLPRGWGIVADDAAAGVLAGVGVLGLRVWLG